MSHNKYLIHFIPNKKLNSYEIENLLSTINSIYDICHIVNFTIEKQRAGEAGDYFIYFSFPFYISATILWNWEVFNQIIFWE